MKIEFIRKWKDSGNLNCPSLYKTETGDYVVQGWKLDEATRAQLLNVAGDEDAVLVPADVIAGIIAGTA